MTAAEIAKQRFEEFVQQKLTEQDGRPVDGLTQWEFYTHLLNQAKAHKLNYSGYASPAYQQDRAAAIAACKAEQEAKWETEGFKLPLRRKHGPHR